MKRCPIILNNEAFTVIEYDGKPVQLPAIHHPAKFLNIEYRDGHYVIAAENQVFENESTEETADSTPVDGREKRVRKKRAIVKGDGNAEASAHANEDQSDDRVLAESTVAEQ